MQDFVGLFAAVVVISASGVMTPGPLFTATISLSAKQTRYSGLYVAAGHTLVEFPLVVLLGFSIFSYTAISEYRQVISILGALSIFVFASIQIYSAFKTREIKNSKYGAVLSGVLFSAFNPFFLAWWLTIGVKLISDSVLVWSIWGIFVVFAMHIWMDYAWLVFVSMLTHKGVQFFSRKIYKVFLISVNLAMIYFGVSFIS